MASSMISNVLGYLCPAKSENNAGGATVVRDDAEDRENDYGIEDQEDDWQIVRKMSDVAEEQEDVLDGGSGEALFALEEDETGMDEENMENRRRTGQLRRACPNKSCWLLAPPPCFTRSAPSPSTNPLENLLIEHPSMSVYLLPVAASSASRRASLYRSAPPLIMEVNLGRTNSPPATSPHPVAVAAPDQPIATCQRVPHAKRKRRLRAQRHAGTIPLNTAAVAEVPATPPRGELDLVRMTEEEEKQGQNEEKDLRNGKKLLAKNQLQRNNQLPEITGPKKRTNRDGNYRCLH